jgi:hypothetical protein
MAPTSPAQVLRTQTIREAGAQQADADVIKPHVPHQGARLIVKRSPNGRRTRLKNDSSWARRLTPATSRGQKEYWIDAWKQETCVLILVLDL